MGDLSAGFAVREITPPAGLPMAGYAARIGVSRGMLDPLYARAAVFRAGRSSAALVLFDLVGMSTGAARMLRRRVAVAVGIPESALFLSCTHTHAGPAAFADTDRDPQQMAYRQMVADATADALLEAGARARGVTMRAVQVPVEDVSANRIDPAWPVDRTLSVAWFSSEGGLAGVMANFACHPTVLGADNLLYSGDLHGHAAAQVEAATGVPCLLTNGAEGDVSTRFVRRRQDPKEMRRLGGILGRAILTAEKRAGPADARGGIAVAGENVRLPVRRPPAVSEAEQAVERAAAALDAARLEDRPAPIVRSYETRLQGAMAQLRRAQEAGGSVPAVVRLDGCRVGTLRWVAVPGELFSEAVLRVRAQVGGWWIVLGLTNGVVGYLPGERVVGRETYESLHSPYAPSAATAVSTGIRRVLLSLGRKGDGHAREG